MALGAASYLKEKLAAEEFAEIDPLSFFELGGVFVQNNLVQPTGFPQSKFYYWRREKPGNEGE